MRDSQRLVLMIQPTRLQGLIWQAVLKSQKLAVIWESPDTNLEENLSQLQQAGLALPDLLLIDVRLRNFNPFAFCRWCRKHCPEVKVVLVNASKTEIIPSERQWAMLQGAAELLPAFEPENLMTSVVDGVRRVLQVLDEQTLDNGSLVSVLLNIKRELEARRITQQEGSRNGKAMRDSAPGASSDSFTKSNKIESNDRPFPAKLTNNESLSPEDKRRDADQDRTNHSFVDSDGKLIVPQNDPSNDEPPSEPPPTRMYRGRKY
jgi:CheY-like chemotaxis protein